jgi:hypothetical protein
VRLKGSGQLLGWSLVLALPLRVLCRPTDLVPAYDAGLSRLYLVDSQPGGNGLAVWLYQNVEQVLPLAYDVALDNRNDALLEPVARADMDWLLGMLGGELNMPTTGQRQPALHPATPAPARTEPPRRESPRQEPLPAQRSEPSPAPEPARSEPAARQHKPVQRAEPPADTAERQAARTPARQSKPPESAEPSAEPPSSPPADKPKRQSARKSKAQSDPPADKPARSSARKSKAQNDPPADKPARSSARKSKAQSKPAQPAEPPPAEVEVTPPDPDAILQRLQSLRSRSEPAAPQPPAARRTASSTPVKPRFKAGDLVLCLPYGMGVVQNSQIEDEQEILHIDFEEHGPLAINTAMSMVRRLDQPRSDAEDEH